MNDTKAVKVLADGTRIYKRGTPYKPREGRRAWVPRRPVDPRAVRFHGDWFIPFDTIEESERVMPETLPDDTAYEHMMKLVCHCGPCNRPQAEYWRRVWRRHHGLQP